MYRIRVNFSGSGVVGPSVATHYFSESGGTAQQAVTALAGFYEDLTAVMSESVSIASEADVATIDSSDGSITGVITTTPFSDVGLSGSGMLAVASQGLVQWRTGVSVGSRELRGRTFVPGMVSAAAALGRPTSSLVTALTAAGNALIADTTCALLVWSRTYFAEGQVTAAASPNYFAVLRSRRD